MGAKTHAKEGSSNSNHLFNVVNLLSHTWVTITITIIRKEHLIVTSFYVVKIPSHTWVTIY